MNRLQAVLTGLVIAAGLATLLASSLTDDDDDESAVPVTVNYTLETAGTGFSRELETREGIVTAMLLTGSYDANSGDGLTLDDRSLNLSMNDSFDLEIVASGDELLTGTSSILIDDDLVNFGLDRDPTSGRFSSLFDGTSTVVDVTSSGVDVAVGDADPVSLSWSDFVAREDGADANLDERMASAAYNILSSVLRAVLLVEDLTTDIESERDMLQSMGVDERLDLQCDNLASDEGDTPEARLTWTDDANGDGEVGETDSFEAIYQNCRNSRDRYLDGTIDLTDYVPDRGDGLRTLGANAELRGRLGLFNSETVVDFDTTPSASSPLYNGFLTIDYVEVARSTL